MFASYLVHQTKMEFIYGMIAFPILYGLAILYVKWKKGI
nr:MAG TPA: hypothetical protein [Caudoviricetes sp.]